LQIITAWSNLNATHLQLTTLGPALLQRNTRTSVIWFTPR
jgi:hypothetical protein